MIEGRGLNSPCELVLFKINAKIRDILIINQKSTLKKLKKSEAAAVRHAERHSPLLEHLCQIF